MDSEQYRERESEHTLAATLDGGVGRAPGGGLGLGAAGGGGRAGGAAVAGTT
jgi:hypothetical protein